MMNARVLAVAIWISLSGAAGAQDPAATPTADEAFAAFEVAMQEGRYTDCRVMLAELREAFPADKRLAKALSDVAGTMIEMKQLAEGRLLLLPLLKNGAYADLDPEQTINGRIWYVRAATRMGERDEARKTLLTLLDPDNPVSVIKAHDTLVHEKLVGGMAQDDLETWKLAFQAIILGGTSEKIKELAAERLDILNNETSGTQVALLRAFEDKYQAYRTTRGTEAKAIAKEAAEAALQKAEAALEEAESNGTLEELDYLLRAKFYRGELLYSQGSRQSATEAFQHVLKYTGDPRIKDIAVLGQSQYYTILCGRGGRSNEEEHEELLALLANPTLDDGLIIKAFEWLASIAEQRDDDVAAYQYRSEVVLNTPTPRLAALTASQMQAMEKRDPEMKEKIAGRPPSDAWLALKTAGRIVTDAQGRERIRKLVPEVGE